jgi:hypothetical protein
VRLLIDAPCPLFASHGASIRLVGSVDIDELRSFIWGEERPWAVEPESAASRAELTRRPGAKVRVLSVERGACGQLSGARVVRWWCARPLRGRAPATYR